VGELIHTPIQLPFDLVPRRCIPMLCSSDAPYNAGRTQSVHA